MDQQAFHDHRRYFRTPLSAVGGPGMGPWCAAAISKSGARAEPGSTRRAACNHASDAPSWQKAALWQHYGLTGNTQGPTSMQADSTNSGPSNGTFTPLSASGCAPYSQFYRPQVISIKVHTHPNVDFGKAAAHLTAAAAAAVASGSVSVPPRRGPSSTCQQRLRCSACVPGCVLLLGVVLQAQLQRSSSPAAATHAGDAQLRLGPTSPSAAGAIRGVARVPIHVVLDSVPQEEEDAAAVVSNALLAAAAAAVAEVEAEAAGGAGSSAMPLMPLPSVVALGNDGHEVWVDLPSQTLTAAAVAAPAHAGQAAADSAAVTGDGGRASSSNHGAASSNGRDGGAAHSHASAVYSGGAVRAVLIQGTRVLSDGSTAVCRGGGDSTRLQVVLPAGAQPGLLWVHVVSPDDGRLLASMPLLCLPLSAAEELRGFMSMAAVQEGGGQGSMGGGYQQQLAALLHDLGAVLEASDALASAAAGAGTGSAGGPAGTSAGALSGTGAAGSTAAAQRAPGQPFVQPPAARDVSAAEPVIDPQAAWDVGAAEPVIDPHAAWDVGAAQHLLPYLVRYGLGSCAALVLQVLERHGAAFMVEGEAVGPAEARRMLLQACGEGGAAGTGFDWATSRSGEDGAGSSSSSSSSPDARTASCPPGAVGTSTSASTDGASISTDASSWRVSSSSAAVPADKRSAAVSSAASSDASAGGPRQYTESDYKAFRAQHCYLQDVAAFTGIGMLRFGFVAKMLQATCGGLLRCPPAVHAAGVAYLGVLLATLALLIAAAPQRQHSRLGPGFYTRWRDAILGMAHMVLVLVVVTVAPHMPPIARLNGCLPLVALLMLGSKVVFWTPLLLPLLPRVQLLASGVQLVQYAALLRLLGWHISTAVVVVVLLPVALLVSRMSERRVRNSFMAHMQAQGQGGLGSSTAARASCHYSQGGLQCAKTAE